MADDRVYMQCNICGKKLFLGKQLGWSAFYWENYGLITNPHSSPLEVRLNVFFGNHTHPESNSVSWNGDYSIVYESENNGEFDEKWSPHTMEKVVRCEDCKHYIKHDKRCGLLNHGVKTDFFCGWGERRDDADN